MRRERITITIRHDILNKIDQEIDGEKIRNRSHAIELFLAEKLKSGIISKAIILGGGQGIKQKNKVIPKFFLPLGGKTLIESNIEKLKSVGVNELMLAVGSYGQQIRSRLKDGAKYKMKILYFERDQGTASVLRQAKSLLNDTFLMMNGDILLKEIDLDDMYEFHKIYKDIGGLGTVLITTSTDLSGLGAIKMKGNQIIKFLEKPVPSAEIESYLVNAGVYLLEPAVCDKVLPDLFSLERDIFPKLAEDGKLRGYYLNTKWVHLHDEERYNNYLASLKKQK